MEDIYNILQISRARRKLPGVTIPPPKAKILATYYEKLTSLFWVSENHLFHAFAWYKYYSLCREYNRGMSAETHRTQASAVLLAAHCVSPHHHHLGRRTPAFRVDRGGMLSNPQSRMILPRRRLHVLPHSWGFIPQNPVEMQS